MSKFSSEERKIRYRSFFDPNHPFWSVLSTVMDLVYLSLLWLLFSLPVITVGAASTALYDTVVHCIRRREEGLVDRFWHTFQRELKNGCLLWTPLLLLAAVWCAAAFFLLSTGDGLAPTLLLANLIVTGILLFGTIQWIFPVLSRYQLEYGTYYSNSIRLLLSHFPATAAMVVIWVLCVIACATWLFPLLILPGLSCLLNSLFIERTFSKLVT